MKLIPVSALRLRRGWAYGPIVEAYFEALAFGRCEHWSDKHVRRRREIAHPVFEKIFSVERMEDVERILLPLHPQPHRPVELAERISGPIRKIAREDHAHVRFAVNELHAAFHPIEVVEAHHQARLIVKVVILALEFHARREISTHAAVIEMAVVRDVAVKSFAPEI